MANLEKMAKILVISRFYPKFFFQAKYYGENELTYMSLGLFFFKKWFGNEGSFKALSKLKFYLDTRKQREQTLGKSMNGHR